VDYHETISWLFDQETMGIKFGLANVTGLLHHLGDPHLKFRSVHVAGTNGKGSVSAMTSSVLRAAGYRTGLYTSPHLVDFRERIQVDGRCIPEKEMLRLAEEVRNYAEREAAISPDKRLTFFELTTAMAFAHFADQGVEEAVVEVGMGGRLDATNVITPDCCAITKISLEHTQYLGSTIAAIAGEKAGIIKPGVPVVTMDQSEDALGVFRSVAAEKGSPLKTVGRDVGFEPGESTLDGTSVFVDELGEEIFVPLLGSYQATNCAVSCGVIIELMRRGIYIPDEAIRRGMRDVTWPGRLEIVSPRPRMIFDVTHTPDGARVVSAEVARLIGRNVVLVLGVLSDKDINGIASFFGPIARKAIATAPVTKRAAPAGAVEAALRPYCQDVSRVEGVDNAIEAAERAAGPDDTILVTGSLYTIGEAKRWFDAKKTGHRDSGQA
jgi:dihydrofolate synthase/folylpolyglutamate synthase